MKLKKRERESGRVQREEGLACMGMVEQALTTKLNLAVNELVIPTDQRDHVIYVLALIKIFFIFKKIEL